MKAVRVWLIRPHHRGERIVFVEMITAIDAVTHVLMTVFKLPDSFGAVFLHILYGISSIKNEDSVRA